MSLLMDALKKAEAAKRLAAGQAETPAGEAETAPESRPPEPEPTPAESSQRLELLEEQLEPPPRIPPRETAQARAQMLANERDRAAAHQLFIAKRPESRAPFWIGLTLCTFLALAVIGAWFWWQLRPIQGGLKAGPALVQAAPHMPPPPAAAEPAPSPLPSPREIPAASSTAPAAPQSISAPIAPPPASHPLSPRTPSSASPGPSGRGTATIGGSDPTRAGIMSEPPAASSAAPAANDETPQLRRSPPQRDQIYPAVARGYAAFMSGDYAGARREYEAALSADPRSIDALNGIAATARRSGLPEQAEAYWMRVLEVDPNDATAQAGLLALRGPGDSVSTESRLKSIASAQPTSGAAHFALGNLYARENRWQEAQQSYFRAYTVEPENPDFQFNLAVSLDQLRQPRLALQYYQSALALAATRPAAFDKDQLASRIRELQSAR